MVGYEGPELGDKYRRLRRWTTVHDETGQGSEHVISHLVAGLIAKRDVDLEVPARVLESEHAEPA